MDTTAGGHPRITIRALLGTVDRAFLTFDTTVRLPTAMLPLGLLLYVATRTGSYGTGGLAVAALSVGGGIGGSLVGVAADRFGQRVVVLVATAVQALALAAVLAVPTGAPFAVTAGLVALLGLANPQAGAMARARWAVVARDRRDRRTFIATAMAFEGAVDEASFVVGPVLVSTVAGLVSPTAGLVVALALALLTQTGFALHRSAIPGHGRHGRTTHGPRAAVPFVFLGTLLVAMAAVGVVFGATQTGVAARMAERGTDGLAGPVYAAMGVGSALTGLLTTRLPRSLGLELRIAIGGGLLVVAGVAAALAREPVPLALGCLLLGIALAPALVSAWALAERAAPAGWGTTTMTALGTANVVGVAAGAALAGQLVDGPGPGAALLLDAAAGVVVLLAGIAAMLRPHGDGG